MTTLNHLNFSEPYLKCGSRSSRNNTMLVHPNFPQPFLGGSRCSYQIYRYNHKICQLKVEFLALSLAQPNGDGICVDDFFTIENGNTTVPKICGENLGQHVYVTFSNRFPISIIIATTARVTFNRRWQLRVSQIRCNSLFKGL